MTIRLLRFNHWLWWMWSCSSLVEHHEQPSFDCLPTAGRCRGSTSTGRCSSPPGGRLKLPRSDRCRAESPLHAAAMVEALVLKTEQQHSWLPRTQTAFALLTEVLGSAQIDWQLWTVGRRVRTPGRRRHQHAIACGARKRSRHRRGPARTIERRRRFGCVQRGRLVRRRRPHWRGLTRRPRSTGTTLLVEVGDGPFKANAPTTPTRYACEHVAHGGHRCQPCEFRGQILLQ